MSEAAGEGGSLADEEKKAAADATGHGPKVPGVEHGDTVNGQDDVDDLLSSLGF